MKFGDTELFLVVSNTKNALKFAKTELFFIQDNLRNLLISHFLFVFKYQFVIVLELSQLAKLHNIHKYIYQQINWVEMIKFLHF
mgnify:FL=1